MDSYTQILLLTFVILINPYFFLILNKVLSRIKTYSMSFIDLFRLSGLEKTHFAHKKGFTATVKRMSTEELYTYIQHALK